MRSAMNTLPVHAFNFSTRVMFLMNSVDLILQLLLVGDVLDVI